MTESARLPNHLGGHCGVTHVDEGVLDLLIQDHGVVSLLDVGCGPGGMLSQARGRGLRVLGVDGDPSVAQGDLPVRVHDYTCGPLHLAERFDLAWSVEFLEHVEEQYQENYMATFASAGMVFCTAAPPGKPGHHHVNCRDQDYWVSVFATHGWEFEAELTRRLRRASTMRREFVQESGMAFVRARAGRLHRRAQGGTP